MFISQTNLFVNRKQKTILYLVVRAFSHHLLCDDDRIILSTDFTE